MPNSTVYVSPGLRPSLEASEPSTDTIKKWLNGSPIQKDDTNHLRDELTRKRKSNEPSTLDRSTAWLKGEAARRKKTPLEQALETITLHTITKDDDEKLSVSQNYTNALKFLDDMRTFDALPTLTPLDTLPLLSSLGRQSNKTDNCLATLNRSLINTQSELQLIIDPTINCDEIHSILDPLIAKITRAIKPATTLSEEVAQLKALLELKSELICKTMIKPEESTRQTGLSGELNNKIKTLINNIVKQLPSSEQIATFIMTPANDDRLSSRVINSLSKLQRYTIEQYPNGA